MKTTKVLTREEIVLRAHTFKRNNWFKPIGVTTLKGLAKMPEVSYNKFIAACNLERSPWFSNRFEPVRDGIYEIKLSGASPFKAEFKDGKWKFIDKKGLFLWRGLANPA